MRMDDMILVSIDDHMIEPPDMYRNHVPAKWLDAVPKVVRNEAGVDEWVFQGQKTSTPFGMAATVGWPREEWGFNPGSFSELRPGCLDVLPDHGWLQRPDIHRGGQQGAVHGDAPGLQRLAHRRVVRRIPGTVHP